MARFCSLICAALLAVNVASAQFDAAPLTSNQWVQPTDAGTLVGRIILPSNDGMAQAVGGASVVIASVDGGGISGQAVTDGNGDFTITGVAPGVYSVISRAQNAFARTVIHVIDSTADLGGRYPNLAEIASTDLGYEAVEATVFRYRPPSSDRIITMANADLDALANRVINGETFRVAQFDGGMNGQLYVAGADGPNLIPAPMTNVFLMKNGVEVARAITNDLGDFRVEALELGNYSLLAIGREGMAAISFDLVQQPTAMLPSEPQMANVSSPSQGLPTLSAANWIRLARTRRAVATKGTTKRGTTRRWRATAPTWLAAAVTPAAASAAEVAASATSPVWPGSVPSLPSQPQMMTTAGFATHRCRQPPSCLRAVTHPEPSSGRGC